MERVECFLPRDSTERERVGTSLVSSRAVFVSPFRPVRFSLSKQLPAAPSMEQTPRVDPPRVAQSSLSRRLTVSRRKSPVVSRCCAASPRWEEKSLRGDSHTANLRPSPRDRARERRGRGDIDTRAEVMMTSRPRAANSRAQTLHDGIGNGKREIQRAERS